MRMCAYTRAREKTQIAFLGEMHPFFFPGKERKKEIEIDY